MPYRPAHPPCPLEIQAYELFSHEADTGMVIPAASRLKNVEWETQTALFCWASQGVWPPEADGTEVTKATNNNSDSLCHPTVFRPVFIGAFSQVIADVVVMFCDGTVLVMLLTRSLCHPTVFRPVFIGAFSQVIADVVGMFCDGTVIVMLLTRSTGRASTPTCCIQTHGSGGIPVLRLQLYTFSTFLDHSRCRHDFFAMGRSYSCC